MILIPVNLFRYEQERILRKRHQKQQLQPSLVKILMVPDQTYLTISVVVLLKFV